ncbi:AAA domain-containing protein [Corallococcus sp. EGB]|uniref:AAA domain-containing protein n=1 Tax=Corallococcus sp. EGB TaxID=1521117 RepID=UPI001CBD1B2A|nr:AAA domain-containing protein [Corallococcus sp. EGB]
MTALLKGLRPGWGLERQVTLTLLSFGRLLMWRDLEPSRWPQNSPLLTNPLVRTLMGGQAQANEPGGGGAAIRERRNEVYDLDAPEASPPPLITDADSSQHSVLVDVLRGENLVVQGPPGTGKSQTITNLIGAALAAGKTVLFVTQKLAALEVVSRRLQQAGLGEFCLELHSHKTQKQQFMEDLRRRLKLDANAGAPRPLTEQVSSAASILRAHSERMHKPFGMLGMSPHDVFWKVSRAEAELGDAVVELDGLRFEGAEEMSPTSLAEVRDAVRGLAAQLADVRRVAPLPSAHPWAGVTNDALTDKERQTLIQRFASWEESALRLEKALAAFTTRTGVTPRSSVLAADALVSAVRVLPPLPEGAPPELVPVLLDSAQREGLRTLLDAIESVQAQWAGLEAGWRSQEALTAPALRAAEAVLDIALRLLFPDTTMVTLTRAHEAVGGAARALEQGRRFMTAVASSLEVDVSLWTPQQLQIFARVIEAMAALDEATLEWRDARWVEREVEESLRQAHGTCSTLKEQARALSVRFMPELVPPLATLKAHAVAVSTAPFIPWLSSPWRAARRDFQAMAHGVRPTRPVLSQGYTDLLAHHAARERFHEDAALKAALGARFQGIDTRFDRILSWLDAYRTIDALLLPLGERGAELRRAVLERPASHWREALAKARVLGEDLPQVRDVSASVQEAATRMGLPHAPWNTEPCGKAQDSLDALLKHLGEVLKWARMGDASPSLPLSQLQGQLRRVREACEAEERLEAHAPAAALPGVVYRGRKTSIAGPRSALRHVDDVFSAPLPEGLAEWLLREDTPRRQADLLTATNEVEAALVAYKESAAQAWGLGKMAPGAWEDLAAEKPLQATVMRLRQARERAATLPAWCAYQRQRRAVARTRGTTGFLERVDTRPGLEPDRLLAAFEAVFFRTLAEAVLRDQPELDQFTGAVHASQREEFARLDTHCIEKQGRYLARQLSQRPVPSGVSSTKVGAMTETHLLKHELGKKQRHLPIRELVARAGSALQTLMPCFMMGPQSVAQYLPAGQLTFDLVVMDEASQMRPEDALGAIARGRQLVVVGDPEQLPPTNFFAQVEQEDVASDDEEGDEAQGPSFLEDSESILTAAAERFPTRMLRWHYRSRHPALIAFSNREFYNGDLITFPAPGEQLEGLGLHFHKVEKGLYESNRNVPEAREVLAKVKEHARTRPEQSLLVVTLNSKQRDLIDDLVTAEEKTDASLRAFLAKWEKSPMPFDVKNLENVQGDERDAIFVSVTFGPDKNEKFRMNFGPINQADGYRRLNVLFTRARCALTVFASFEPSDLKIQESSPRGMRVLQRYLFEARGEAVAHGVGSGRPPDSDFELAVAKALTARGFEVVPQVGVAGYFIDMALRHPRQPGRYILGVECDGERYHSSRSARDRDRLRDQVLKGLGWNLHRIWSTDWFRSPSEEVARIVAHVEALLREEAAAELPAVVREEPLAENQMRAVSA